MTNDPQLGRRDFDEAEVQQKMVSGGSIEILQRNNAFQVAILTTSAKESRDILKTASRLYASDTPDLAFFDQWCREPELDDQSHWGCKTPG